MKTYAIIKKVMSFNKKLIAYDIEFDNEYEKNIKYVISNIITNTNDLQNIPIIVNIDSEILEELDILTLLNNRKTLFRIESYNVNKYSYKKLKHMKSLGYNFIIRIDNIEENFKLIKDLASIIEIDYSKLDDNIEHIKEYKILVYGLGNKFNETNTIDYYIEDTIYNKIELHNENKENYNIEKLIGELYKKNPDMKEITTIIKRDTMLLYKALCIYRYLKIGKLKGVNTDTIITNIGIDNLRKIAFILRYNSNYNNNVVKIAYLRAIIAEKIAMKVKRLNISTDTAYLIGLLSNIDKISRSSTLNPVYYIGLDDRVTDAIVFREGNGGVLLNLIIAYEEADWKKVDKYSKILNLSKKEIDEIYFNSIEETERIYYNLI